MIIAACARLLFSRKAKATAEKRRAHARDETTSRVLDLYLARFIAGGLSRLLFRLSSAAAAAATAYMPFGRR